MDHDLTIRLSVPARRKIEAKEKYTHYRADLRRDFLNSCGYCGDSDERIDRIGFHIDHFAPMSLFPALEREYTNLVYACRFCNVSKSDHWIGKDPVIPNDGKKGFVDPCSDEYEQHLQRLPTGQIIGISDLGKYIVKRLKLHLLRHELLWNARRMRLLREKVNVLIEELERRDERGTPQHIELLMRFRELTMSIEDYEFRANN